jgi:hypothetical protein
MAEFLTISDLASPRTIRLLVGDEAYFPDMVRWQRRVNWRPQDTSIGTKPLMYENREPKVLTFPELWMDNTESNLSLADSLDTLESWTTDEVDSLGSPPPLLVAWGDRRQRCVVQDLTVEETFFTAQGFPIRAKISMEFLEIQEDDRTATAAFI